MQKEKKYKDARLNIAAEELGGFRERQRRIAFLKEKLTEYEATYVEIKAIAYDIERIQGGERKDRLVEMACKWADLIHEVKLLKEQNERELWYIRDKLNNLTVLKTRVLELYYLECYPLIDIAREMGYSFDGIKKLKFNALKKYADL